MCDSIDWRWKASSQVSTYCSRLVYIAVFTVISCTGNDDPRRPKALYTTALTKQAAVDTSVATIRAKMTLRRAGTLETGPLVCPPSTATAATRERLRTAESETVQVGGRRASLATCRRRVTVARRWRRRAGLTAASLVPASTGR